MTEDIIINYRDPLTGVITIFLIIFIASFVTYTLGIYNERKSRKEYRKLLERFELGTLKKMIIFIFIQHIIYLLILLFY